MIYPEKKLKTDICIIGGGLAGISAAISASRHGSKVVLMQDRPVLGGNCSSEIRMWALGCHGKNNRETGIMEELLLENMYRNPTRVFPIWDSILYGKVKAEPGITLLLNCSCNDIVMDGNKIRSIKGWQLTTYTWYSVEAEIFVDCSGDSILAPLSGALHRCGREGQSEYGESIAPDKPDSKTMGMSCLIQARETSRPVTFTPPDWAEKITKEQLDGKGYDLHEPRMNYWWMELGGEMDTIKDTEIIRDQLIPLAFGVWDYLKNSEESDAANWDLEWMGYLPGKRESIRYIGDYVMTQMDVEAEGRFDDLIAYGGWSMDDHNPAGFRYPGHPTIYHPAPTPFGIPYRCLYSRNIDNLMFAGRNISVTHSAMSSSRVMATCAILGQAAGTAAHLAIANDCTPRQVYEKRLRQLQNLLMDDDCYLPWHHRKVSPLMEKVHVKAACEKPELLWDGIDRTIGEEDHGCWMNPGDAIEFSLDRPTWIEEIRIVFDSDLERESCTGHTTMKRYPMLCNRFHDMEPFGFPQLMVKDFSVEYQDDSGLWQTAIQVKENHQRLFRVKLQVKTSAVRLIPLKTWGSDKVHLYSCEILSE